MLIDEDNMPIYEYKCEDCENVQEVLQKMIDQFYNGNCEKCGGKHWQRVISMSDFHLKGGGWYKDGYQKTQNK